MKSICLVGDIVSDLTLSLNTENKLRLGGITHAARALWAIQSQFSAHYTSPSYNDKAIKDYYSNLSCTSLQKFGTVYGSPYLFLIKEAKEIGDQGYEFILRDLVEIEYSFSSIKIKNETHYLLFSGNYDLRSYLKFIKTENTKASLHIDLTNNIKSLRELEELETKFSTIFLSTSSDIFKNYYKNNFENFCNHFSKHTDILVLKENRGGIRVYDFLNKQTSLIPAQNSKIAHSIGVGDVFNAVFLHYLHDVTLKEALYRASWVATEYAKTTFPDDFEKNALRVKRMQFDDLENLGGVSLPWEKRKEVNIYIAAPDFNFVNTKHIQALSDALEYHNFSPRRPVQENGQMEEDADKNRRQELYYKDMLLLEQCQILVAVLIYNDPGTLIEIGLAKKMGLNVVVFDPNNIATNCFLTEVPDLLSSDLDEIISYIFDKSSKLI